MFTIRREDLIECMTVDDDCGMMILSGVVL